MFRIGYERDGKMELVNFVAVEPIVGNKRGFSELELSSVVDEDEPNHEILPGRGFRNLCAAFHLRCRPPSLGCTEAQYVGV